MAHARPVQAIQTRYAGCHFRSRLEARWAVFFDALGIRWEYEPEGFETSAGRYLPDFRIDIPQTKAWGQRQWFEVKPDGAGVDPRHAALAQDLGQPLIVARGIPRSYADQLRGMRSPLLAYGIGYDARPLVPVAFCDSTSLALPSSGGVGPMYCALGDNRHWCLEEMAYTMQDERCHLALYGVHGDRGAATSVLDPDSFMTFPPYVAQNVDAAYAAARSARFEHGDAACVPHQRTERAW